MRNYKKEKEEILKLVDGNNYIDMTTKEISEKFNMHRSSVWSFFNENGIKTLQKGEKEEKILLSLADGKGYIDMNLKEISEITGLTKTQVNYRAKKCNLTLKKYGKMNAKDRHPELYEELKKDENINFTELEGKYYVFKSQIGGIYKEIHGESLNTRNRRKKEQEIQMKIEEIYNKVSKEKILKHSRPTLNKALNLDLTPEEYNKLLKKYGIDNIRSTVYQNKVKLVQSLSDEEIKSYTYKSIQQKLGINQQIFQEELKRRGIKKVSQRKRAMEYFKENGTCSYKDYPYKNEVTSNAFSVYKLDFKKIQEIKNKK